MEQSLNINQINLSGLVTAINPGLYASKPSFHIKAKDQDYTFTIQCFSDKEKINNLKIDQTVLIEGILCYQPKISSKYNHTHFCIKDAKILSFKC